MCSNIRNAEIFKDGKFCQVLILSFSFMFIFTAFRTSALIGQTVLKSVKIEDPSFSGDGYTSLAIVYGVFAILTWIAPSIVAILFARKALFVSSFFYFLFVIGFLYPRGWILYLTSATLGAAAAVLWTAQGNLLSLTSSPQTISRNSGVFWAINQCSLFFGNVFVFWQFHGKTHIDSHTRMVVFGLLALFCVFGSISFLFLKDLRPEQKEDGADKTGSIGKRANRRTAPVGVFSTAGQALKEAGKLSITPYMLLLAITSLYTGIEQSFYGGVYSTSVGFTEAFGEDAKRLMGLVGICIGVGAVTGGALFGLLGPLTTRKGRTPIIILGLFTHILCFVLVYLNLPNGASLGSTKDVSFFTQPYVSVAILCAFLLGFGDACLQTQLISMFASCYADKASAAFAIFKFIQSAGSAGSFFLSGYMGLHLQLIILAIFCILGSVCFCIVEWRMKLKKVLAVLKLSSSENVELEAEKMKTAASECKQEDWVTVVDKISD